MIPIKNIYCIDIKSLSKKIRDLSRELKISESQGDTVRAGVESYEIKILKEIKNEIKPLLTTIEPLIKNAHFIGEQYSKRPKLFPDKEQHFNNLTSIKIVA